MEKYAGMSRVLTPDRYSRAEMEDATQLPDEPFAWQQQLAAAERDPRAAALLAREANGRGEHMLALSLAEKALRQLSLGSDPRESLPLRMQMALALARSGSTEEAMEVLKDAAVAVAEDAEALGLMGRLHKDLADGAVEAAEVRRLRQRALEFYAKGFAADQSPYCGINTAVLSAMTGDMPRARETALRVLKLPPQEDRLWAVATAAAAHMICGEPERTRDALRQADRAGRVRRSDLATVRRDVRRLAAVLHGDAEVYDNCFDAAAVAVFHGRGDKLDDGDQARLARWLQDNHVVCAWSAAASGAESEFLERAAVLGIETCTVLPEAETREHCRRAVGRAALVDFLGENAAGRPSADALARHVATARAMARAASWDAPLLLVSAGRPPSSWANLAHEVFSLGDAGGKECTAAGDESAMRAMLCVWPVADVVREREAPDLHALWEKHPARCGTQNGVRSLYMFAWPTMAEAAKATVFLKRELADGHAQTAFTFLLHASSHEPGDGRLGGWAKRIYPGRTLATGRFADLAALERSRAFDLSYMGMLDCQAEPLGVRLYQVHERQVGSGPGRE